MGQSRTSGLAVNSLELDGEAEPRLTSGGIAEAPYENHFPDEADLGVVNVRRLGRGKDNRQNSPRLLG